ncbi:MAG TPA: DUF3794 domain-containing protein [Clostridiaceae bacterium]|nr:DUF3794 domain-containing protein [Clostridiaceae bacterium]
MSVELGKETVRVSQVIGENTAQTIVENDIIVPDTKPDVANVLVLDGDVFIKNTECLQGKINISGTINYKILYLTDEAPKRVKSMESQSDFSYSMDFVNVREGMSCRADCGIEYFDYNIINGRKLNVKAILNITAKAACEDNIHIVSNVSNLEDVQVLEDNVKVNVYLGETESDVAVNEAMEIPAGKPPVKEILLTGLKITNAGYKVSDDKVAVNGMLNISTMYIADNEEENIQHMEHEVPFMQFIELPGLTDNSYCDMFCKIVDSNVEAAEDSDGELRFINIGAGINIKIAGFNLQSFLTIKDAYSPRNILNFEKSKFLNEYMMADENSPVNIKEILSVDDNEPHIEEVFNILSKPMLIDYAVENNSLSVEGLVVNNVLYISDNEEQPVCCMKKEIPFSQKINLDTADENASYRIRLDVLHNSYSIVSPSEIEQRLIINVNVKAFGQNEVALVDNVVENPVDESVLANQPSIVIYFAQPEDTLWNIAKKYYTTVDAIKAMNNMDSDHVAPGQQIFIPKRAS